MPRPSYPILCACAAVALLSALVAWERATGGLSSAPISDLLFPDLRAAKEQRGQLAADIAAGQLRCRQLDELGREAAAGRLSLVEGAARLRELYREEPEAVWVNVCRRFPDASDDERYCRLLIDRVESHMLVADRARAPFVVGRLEAELREHIRRGTLRLPGGAPRASLGTVAAPLSPEGDRRVSGGSR
jgi:hypothetical protein